MSAVPSPVTDSAEIIELLGSYAGLCFGPNRYHDAELGIRRAMCKAGFTDISDYLRLLQSDPAALDALIIEVTVGET